MLVSCWPDCRAAFRDASSAFRERTFSSTSLRQKGDLLYSYIWLLHHCGEAVPLDNFFKHEALTMSRSVSGHYKSSFTGYLLYMHCYHLAPKCSVLRAVQFNFWMGGLIEKRFHRHQPILSNRRKMKLGLVKWPLVVNVPVGPHN